MSGVTKEIRTQEKDKTQDKIIAENSENKSQKHIERSNEVIDKQINNILRKITKTREKIAEIKKEGREEAKVAIKKEIGDNNNLKGVEKNGNISNVWENVDLDEIEELNNGFYNEGDIQIDNTLSLV